jgi:eukaryotic-like serine/threonine-protein kinase
MACPRCGDASPAHAGRCGRCGAFVAETTVVAGVIPLDTTGLPPGGTFGSGAPSTADAGPSTFSDSATIRVDVPSIPRAAGPLNVGQSFGPRYQILKLLGAGGMGVVYQAWDAELNVTVALKVIRSSRWRVSADLEKRLKHELLLARSVTHKNVVRIYDLGEIDATKYITMTYVQGDDLATWLRKGDRFPIDRALRMARQIAAGLEAAHDAGVVHRDLKPANVMIAADDHALIMDFGISVSADETTSGNVIGTLEYMAPEQGAGKTTDARADIYAFGLILYEMLLGPRPAADTAQARLAAMMVRSKQGLPPLRSIDETIPEAVDDLVTRCLARDPAERFQTSSELCAALSRLDDAGELIPIPRRVTRPTLVVLAALTVLLTGATYILGKRMAPEAPPKHPIVSVLVGDFDNRSGDAALDGPLASQALSMALEGAPYVALYPAKEARGLAAQLSKDRSERLTDELGRLIARREGIKVLVQGTIERNGSGYRLGARVVDPVTDATKLSATATADDRAGILHAVETLAGRVRLALGESKTEMEKAAAAETFTAGSLEAMLAYQRAQDLVNGGNVPEALAAYQQAIASDPQLGRAYSGMAIIYRNLGQMDKAEATFNEALKHVDRMTEREKYRTLGAYYFSIARNYPKAIETYETLVGKYPGDQAALSNLAFSHAAQRNFARATEISRQLVELYPTYVLGRNNYASYALYAGDFDESIAQVGKVFEQNPSYQFAFLPLALSQLSKGDRKAGLDTYARFDKLNAFGASVSKLGSADLAIYEGRYRDATALLPAAIAVDEKANDRAAAAAKYVALAEAHAAAGRRDAASAAARKAAALATDESVLFPVAMVFIAAGREDRARAISDTLGSRLEDPPRSYARLIDAEILRAHGRVADAIDNVRDAQKRHDSWWSRFMLGRLYEEVQPPHHAEALAELEAAVKRRGEAADAFIADTPTLRYVPPAYYWLGRAQEGVGAAVSAGRSYAQFLALRQALDQADPLVDDARQRASAAGR